MKKFLRYIIITILFISEAQPLLTQQYSIQQYLSIKGAGSPKYSFDDNRIYFTMNLTGTTQVYYVNKPGDTPVQFSNLEERISGYQPNPKLPTVLLESDVGGSEYDQFFLTDESGKDVKIITGNEPRVVYGFGRWSPDGTFYTYFSNKRSAFFYDIYTYNVSAQKSELIYSSDHSNYPSAISTKGISIVISRSYSTYDNDLYLLNRDSNTLKLISTHDNFNEPAQFFASSFDKNDENIYLITNDKSDLFRIGIYNIKNDTIIFPEYGFLNPYKNCEVQRVTFSPDRKVMMIQVNDNGYDRIFMYDHENKSEIKIPEKLKTLSITAISFANNISKVIVGVNSAVNPSVLYEWNYKTGTVEQVTKPELAGIDPSSFVEPELVSYTSYDGLEIPAFLYKPKYSAVKKLPCLIMIHGGPEGQATYGFAPIFQYFLSAGYMVIEPNVRGSTGYGKKYAAMDNVRNRENSVKDVAALVEYIKNRGDADINNIAVYGGSYGGYMVLACLTLYPDLFKAGVDIVGISNFVTFLKNTGDYRKNNRQSEYGSLDTDREFLESISPLNRVSSIKAPLMIIHGRNDPRVPVSEAEQMYKAIIKQGGTAELHIYEDEGHGISKQKNRFDVYPKIINFLNKYLKGVN